MKTGTRRPLTITCPRCYDTLYLTSMIAGAGIDPALRLFDHKHGQGTCRHELWVVTTPKQPNAVY